MGSLSSWMRGATGDPFACSVKRIDKLQWMIESPEDPRPVFINMGVPVDGIPGYIMIDGQQVAPVGMVYAPVQSA